MSTSKKIFTDKQKSRVLSFGDEIVLSFGQESGYLLVDGDVKKQAWIPPIADTGETSTSHSNTAAAGCDVMKYVFRVEPPSFYKAIKAFYKLLYAADINPNLFQHQLLDLNFKPVDGVLPSKVEEIRRNALEELALNKSEFARQKSKPVLYGSIIQLCNVYSNDYMAVNARDTYGHESWAVDFQKFARKDCFFRVMPKLRIRAKGEPVRAGDAVVFQSIKTEGFLSFLKQFTESSPLKRTNSTRLTKSLGLSTESDFDATGNDPVRSRHSSLENVSKGWHEVCISSQPHGWTICHFESPLKTLIQKPLPAPSNTKSVASAPSSDASGDKNILKAGSYIRLYHKEKQGYVNAFKDLTGQDLLYHEQVQLAEYSFDALNPQETTSATTFWQVEHKFPFQGTQIPWNQPVRLRHAALNAYLHVEQVSNPFMGSRDNLKPSNFAEVNKPSVFGDYFVTLRSNPGNTSNCLFMFVPVTASTSNVTIGTHVRIQHVGSGCWLSGISSQLNRTRHMEASTYKAARKLGSSELGANLNFNESFKGPGPLMLNVADKEVEQTDLYVLTASTQQHADDYFAISDVEADLAENFRYIHSMVPAVERFLSTSRKGERDQADKKKSERSRTGDYVDSEKFPISKAELTSFKGVITSLIYFCTKSNELNPLKREGIPLISQQTLLRETGMIDMLLQILKVPFDLEQRFLIRKVLLDIQVLDASNSSAEFSRTGEQRISFDDIKCNREPVLSEIFSFVYKMLSVFMLGSDHENQLLVAKEFDILSRHFSLDIGAADAIMQLISGNILIAQSVSEDQILHFMGSLEHDKNPHVVEFLNALCYLDGKPIPKHQTFISRHLVEITGSKIRRTFMNETRVRKSVIEILENPILDSWTPLHEIFDKEEDGLSPQKLKTGISKHKNQQKMFFISTLRLYEALCKGHNRFSINKIVYEWKLITLDECIVGLFDNRLPNSVRALYCDLIRVIFVDYYPISNARNEFILTFEGLEQPPTLNMVLSDANLRGPFQTLPEGPDSDNTSDQSSIFGLHREGFFKIDEWLLKFFEEHRAQYMDHVKENQLVLSTLQLARLLIRYGFYRNMEQFERIIFSMLEILDGRNDARNKTHLDEMESLGKLKDVWWTHGRYENNESNKFPDLIKTEICKIIELYLRFQRELRVYWYMHFWQKAYRQGLLGKKTQQPIKPHYLGFDQFDSLAEKIMEETTKQEFRSSLKPILIDLIKYESEGLKRSAIQILHGLRSPTEELIFSLANVLIIEEQSHISMYKWIKNRMMLLIERLELDNFSGFNNSSESESFGMSKKEVISVLDSFSKLCLIGASVVDDQIEFDQPEGSPTANKITQSIFHDLGMQKHVLDMITNRVYGSQSNAALDVATTPSARPTLTGKPGSLLPPEMDKKVSASTAMLANLEPGTNISQRDLNYQSELLTAAFEFLHNYALDNENHQEYIFLNLDTLLEATHPLRSGCTNAQRERCVSIISEFLSKNPSMCSEISVSQVRRILELSGGRRVEYIKLLIAITEVEGKIIKRNQNLVMKLIAERKEIYVDMERLTELLLRGSQNEDADDESMPQSRDEDENESSENVGPPQIVIRGLSEDILKITPSEHVEKILETETTYFKNLLTLMSICCKEKNKMMQTICRNVFSIDQIILILEHESSGWGLKGAALCFLAVAYISHNASLANGKQLHSHVVIWEIIEQTLELLRERNSAYPDEVIPELEEYLFQGAFVFLEVFYSKCFNISLCDHNDSLARDVSSDLYVELLDTKANVQPLISCIRNAGFKGNKVEEDEGKEQSTTATHKTSMTSAEVQSQSSDKAKTISKSHKNANDTFLLLVSGLRRDPEGQKRIDVEFRDMANCFRIYPELSDERKSVLHEPIKCLIDHLDQHGNAYDQHVQNANIRTIKNPTTKNFKFKTNAILVDVSIYKEQKREDQYYDTKTLQILKWIVQEPIDLLSRCNRYLNPEQWNSLERRKREYQNEMDILGCTLMAKKLLISNQDGVVGAALQLLISLLDGGNRQVQETLLNHWIATKEEQFFHSMFSRVESAINVLLEADKQETGDNILAFHTDLQTDAPVINDLPRQQSFEIATNVKMSKDDIILARVSYQGLDRNTSFAAVSQQEKELQDLKDEGVLELSFDDDGGLNLASAEASKLSRYNYEMLRMLLRFFQLIAEGHNISLQLYMQYQSENAKSYDIVKSVVDYIHAIVPLTSAKNIPVIVQAFDTLIDFAQGCTRNQVNIFQSKIIQPINRILEETYPHIPSELVISLKGKAVLCLLSLLEDDSESDTKQIFEDMSQTLNVPDLTRNMDDMYDKILESRKDNATISKSASLQETLHALLITSQELYGVAKIQFEENIVKKYLPYQYNLMREGRKSAAIDLTSASKQITSVTDNQNSPDQKEEEEDEMGPIDCGFIYAMLLITLLPFISSEQRRCCDESNSFKWFKNNTGHIEIVRETMSGQKQLYMVLYPIPEICYHLRRDTSDKFLWSKKRISPQEKIEDFINQSESIIYEIRNQARVADNKWLKMIASLYNFWWRGAYVLSLILNFANLLCMKMGDFGTRSGCPFYLEFLRVIVGCFHLLFWSLSTAEYIIIKLPLIVNDNRIKKDSREQYETMWTNRAQSKVDLNTSYEPTSAISTHIESHELIEGFWKDPGALYHASMVLLSILGLKWPALYAIHLLDFLFRDEVLQGVISSITLNWNSLSKTALLGVIIVYIYSVVSYVFFRKSFDSKKGHYCESLIGCFLTILSYGVRSGGGVGDLLNVPSDDMYYSRIMLDLSFFLVVVVFLLNVIFGIIFDNFGQLREERRAIYEDLRSVCFICSIKATEFQQSKGFEYHSHHEHNIWHYLFFLVHLKTKDVTEYTSHEQYIAEKLAASDLTFFPINRALSLKKRETNDVEERLKRIEDKLLMINVNGMLSAKIDDDYGSFMVEPPLTTNNTTPGPTTTRRPSLFHLFP